MSINIRLSFACYFINSVIYFIQRDFPNVPSRACTPFPRDTSGFERWGHFFRYANFKILECSLRSRD